ncbi:hypothetical protein NDU88_002216 [Pleurodeles waltl]|uniref:Uncharacterized protein n=1 Tax=Pleurodeles waltl TaxID=8319 RepID=A0AAV7TLY7_PLEWA|nr:hypothetical protein NDU88_002216 [Pleurodeles waltl]
MASGLGRTSSTTGTAKQAVVKEDRDQVDVLQSRRTPPRLPHFQKPDDKICGNCGLEDRTPGVCPAKGKTCSPCVTPNLFAKAGRGGKPRPGARQTRKAAVRQIASDDVP